VAGIRRAFLALAAGWLVYLLEPLSSTGLDFSFCAGAFLITALAGLTTLALLLLRRPVSRVGLVAWLGFPLGAAALLLLFLSSQSPLNPLFRLRFELSRTALDAAAREALAQRPSATPTWVGLFPVHRVDVFSGEVRLMSSACGVVDECGLLHRTGPLPPGRAKTRLQHLAGPWYHLYAVF
jgi:hypothetical protein